MITEKRLLLKNLGSINPYSIDNYIETGGYSALQKALSKKPEKILQSIENSGLKGRGGAGFPTGIKTRSTSDTCNECLKYIVCNADEGEPGTFKDRSIMENNPHMLIEGICIAAFAVGAQKGYIYIRAEYYKSIELLQKAIKDAYSKNLLGQNIYGKNFNFDLEIALGAGSYLCGCLLYTSPSPRDRTRSRMPSSA